MKDPVDILLERTFADARHAATDPVLIDAVLARVRRRARARSLVLGAAALAGANVIAVLLLPALGELAALVENLVMASQQTLPGLAVVVLAAASPWLVAMLDDRV